MAPKTTWLQVRVSPEEKARIRADAEKSGTDLSSFVLSKVLPPALSEFDTLVAWVLAQPDSHVPMAECVDYLQALPAARGAELAAMPARFTELPAWKQNLLCAWVEHRAALWGVRAPAWVLEVPALEQPYFGAEFVNLRPWLLVVSPVVYRRRNVFVERGLGWRLVPISPPATSDEARVLTHAFSSSAVPAGPSRRRVAEYSPPYGDSPPLSRELMLRLLGALDEELAGNGVKADLLMVGGAVMTIVFRAREQTKDIDAVFEPTAPVREAVRRIAAREHVADDWLNDAVRGFVTPDGQFDPYFEGEGLRIYVARADYLLAMKILAMRPEGVAPDVADIHFLCRYLGITTAEAAIDVVERYYPVARLQPRHRFSLEEMFEGTK
jgi:uncharacterized protein (DUF1778 family)